MLCLEAIVSDCAGASQTRVNGGSPMLKAVMVATVK